MHRFAVLLAFVPLLVASRAAADGRGDGLYGRFDASTQLVLGVGGGFSRHDGSTHATATGDLRLRVLGSGGPVIAGIGPNANHRLFVGVEVRPLFPALFLQSLSTGHGWLDLLLQSIAAELGAGFPLDGGRHVGFAWGLAFEIPLVMPDRFADGMYLRLGTRHVNAKRSYQLTRDDRELSEWTAFATLVLSIGLGNRGANWEPPRFR